MDEGEIVVEGHAGDLTGHSMRGGKIFVRDNVGFRVGIHMKQVPEENTQNRLLDKQPATFWRSTWQAASSSFWA
jgi:hypothetical protein